MHQKDLVTFNGVPIVIDIEDDVTKTGNDRIVVTAGTLLLALYGVLEMLQVCGLLMSVGTLLLEVRKETILRAGAVHKIVDGMLLLLEQREVVVLKKRVLGLWMQENGKRSKSDLIETGIAGQSLDWLVTQIITF